MVSSKCFSVNPKKADCGVKKRAFHLNKAHYLKPFIGSSGCRGQKLQCVEEYKYTSNQVCSH